MMERCKIFDATLRDGGYYTDWDFDNEIVAYNLNDELDSVPTRLAEYDITIVGSSNLKTFYLIVNLVDEVVAEPVVCLVAPLELVSVYKGVEAAFLTIDRC